MRLPGAALLALATTGLCTGETVCLKPIGSVASTYMARAIAARILRTAGVQVEFKDDRRTCAGLGESIVITLSDRTPDSEHPGALAYALPYERTHVVVFYDRILGTARPAGVPSLLGHVLAHEIADMLQGVEHHSASGVMKAKWDYRDHIDMQKKPLLFTEEDLLMIRQESHQAGFRCRV